MATVTLENAVGSGGGLAAFKNGLAGTGTIAGIGGASVPSLPTGSNARRPAVDWLPPPHVPLDRDGKVFVNPVWYRAFREICENRLGGVQGQSVTQVADSVTATQTSINTVVAYAQQVGQYAEGVAATAAATREVAVDNALSGSGSIPASPTSSPTYEP